MNKAITAISTIIIIGVCIEFIACQSNPASPVTTTATLNAPGVFILNQGSPSPTTLDYYDITANSYHSNVIGPGASLATDGNDLQFGGGDTMYMVVENANSIYAVADNTGGIITTYTSSSFNSPYKMWLLNDSLAAVAEYNDNKVTTYNLRSQQAIRDVVVGDNPQAIVYTNGNLYVACPGESGEKRLDVINPFTGNDIYMNIGVNPVALTALGDSVVLALCGGAYTSPSGAALYFISASTGAVLTSISLTGNPTELSVDGNNCYILNGTNVLKVNVATRIAADTTIVNASFQALYGMTVDTANHHIYLADALNYTQNGIFYEYDESGNMLHSATCGVNPGTLAVRYK